MSSIDAYHIDKARVRLSFGRAASAYDHAAVLQREVLERMLERLELVALKPNTILDAGCGTGLGGMRLAKRYPQAGLLALDFADPMLRLAQSRLPWLSRLGFGRRHRFICGDMEALPLQDHCVEMAWSNLAVQWCNDLDGAFREFHRVLAPGGLLTFSTFGPDTLKELRQATSVDAAHTHVSRFIDMHDIGDALVRSGFSAPVMDVEFFTLTYDTALEVMRDLKAIGAGNATAGRPAGLAGKRFLQHLTQNYERFRQTDGKLPATYEVVYGHAWKPENPPPKTEDGAQVIHFHRK